MPQPGAGTWPTTAKRPVSVPRLSAVFRIAENVPSIHDE
jgi:hypothetical protein